MYLNCVLADIHKESQPPKALNAEHLYKLNEAIFNLPEEDLIDTKMANRLFQVVQKVRTAYFDRKICDSDHNFFYDYVALLGTMHNQHYFTNKQTEKMLSWLTEALACDGIGPSNNGGGKNADRFKSLQEENKILKEEYAKLLEVQEAVKVIQNYESFVPPEAKAKAGAKKKSKKSAGEHAAARSERMEPEAEAVEGTTDGQKKSKKKNKSRTKNAGGAGAKKWKAKDVVAEADVD